MSAIGFDIGNENSYISFIKDGGVEILDNEYGQRSTPTYIGFTDKCRDIGVAAKLKLITNFENTVFGFKKILGKKYDDVEIQSELTYFPHEVSQLPSGTIGVKVSYLKNIAEFSIEQIMAMMLTKLELIIASKLGNKYRDYVIAVPVYFTDAQRRAMLDAVNIAGLNTIKLINESAAVALSYGFYKHLFEEQFETVVFVDLGQSCLTLTVCKFTNDKCSILGCVWDHVGGRDFDIKLVKYFIDDFKNRYDIDVSTNKKALMRLILECESLKKTMSASSLEIKFQLECLLKNADVSGSMKREIFEKLSDQELKKIEINFHRLLEKTHLKPSDVNSVEIVGGSSRIPAVKKLVKKVFGLKPRETLNQDEAVARGCALQCAMLSPSLKSNRKYILDDISSYTIKIIWKNNNLMEESLDVFSFSDIIPSYKLVTISMSEPFSVEAFYVDSLDKLCKIGTFIFGNIPEDVEKNGFIKVTLKVRLNAHGIFNLESAEMKKMNKENEQNYEILPIVDNTTSVDIAVADKEENLSSPEQLAQKVQTSCDVKPYELTIKSEISGLTKLRLNEYLNKEQQMIRQDEEDQHKANVRNALEEFVYEFREKLENELAEFVSETDKLLLVKNLDNAVNWIEEDEGAEAAEYSKKLQDLRKLSYPVFLRRTEWEQRQSVIDNYRQALQQGFDAVHRFIIKGENSMNISDEETQNILKFWEDSKQYLDQYVEKTSELKKFDDVPITVETLRSSLKAFKENFGKMYSELLEKRNVSQDSRESCTGDGLSQNSGNPNQ